MAQKIYDGVNDVARNTIRAYGEVSNIARNLIRGYLGDKNGIARQFWGAMGLVIFDEGEFHHVPDEFDFEENVESCITTIADLAQYFRTASLLWVYDHHLVNTPWTVDEDLFIDSNYADYEVQIFKNEIYIPIRRIQNPSKLRIIAKGNLCFRACRISNGNMTKSTYFGSICSVNLAVKEIDISDSAYIDYIEIQAPDSHEADDEDVTNPYIYQPIPFVVTNRIYTNNNGYGLPGYEWNQMSGGKLRCFLKYREPDGSNQCIYMMSTEPFSVEGTYRWGTPEIHETWYSSQIQANPPIHAIVREGYWWGYKIQNLPQWHTNYRGGWNTNWDKQVGQIVLYGHLNVLPIPTGVENPLQLIKRIEVIGGKIRGIYSLTYPNANVFDAGTISKNNGSRTPVTKPNEGDGVCFISLNGLGTSFGGNWIVTCCIALSSDEALLTAPSIGNNVTSHVINGVTYWIGLQATNASWGGGTQVENSLGLPVYEDLYICEVNRSPTTERVAELIALLGIEVT